jgi:replication factor C large subunit
MWSTYYPKTVEGFVGNEAARMELLSWFKDWVPGTRPALLLGPPGVGKTTFVHSLAAQYNVDLIELNASDVRNGNILNDRITPVLLNSSLFGKQFVIFLDEVDGLSAREDTGAVEFLYTVMKESSIPVILAANKLNSVTKDLSKVSKVISFRKIPPRTSMLYLNYILNEKGVSITPGEKFSIIKNCSGDIRKLLNDAQSKISGYADNRKNFSLFEIEEATNRFFSCVDTETAIDTINASDAIFRDPRFGLSSNERRNDLINAIYTSIISSNVDLSTIEPILNELSKIDVILGKSMRKRNWKILKYLPFVLTYSLIPHTESKQFAYKRYSIGFQYMGKIYFRGRSLRTAILPLSKEFHTSLTNFGIFILPYLLEVLPKTLNFQSYLINSLKDEKAVQVIMKEVGDQISST